jgi:cysteine desulfuration protein SufE
MDRELINNSTSLNDIKEMFSVFDDPLDMISQLIDIGKGAHNLASSEKVDENIIRGCTSKAWLLINVTPNNFYSIKTDSDSHIVSGLLYLLSLGIKNQSKNYINNIDPIAILNSTGLDGHITSQRTNGFISAVETLKQRVNKR